MKEIKAIIFDLDGTLGNTIPLCIESFRRSVEPILGRPISDEEITSTFGPSEEGTIMRLVPNDYDTGIANFLYFYTLLHHRCPRPFDGIYDILNMLKSRGVHIAMVTGKGIASARITLQKFGINDFFEIIKTGCPEGPIKIDNIKDLLSSHPEIHKENVAYVGDSEGDIIAAREAGIPIISAAWSSSANAKELAKMHPDKLFTSIGDFSEWLKSNILSVAYHRD